MMSDTIKEILRSNDRLMAETWESYRPNYICPRDRRRELLKLREKAREKATRSRVLEIGKCIQTLRAMRRVLLDSELRYGLAYAITVLKEYKQSVKAASEGRK